MRKIFLSLITLIACLQFAKAQEFSRTEFSVGLGFNGSNLTDIQNNNYNSDGVLGFNAGISINQYFSRSWSVNIGANFTQKGWSNGNITFDDGTEIDGITYKTSYLTIPVLANWHFGRRKNWYLDFGPYVGFLLNASESSNTLTDTKSYFNNTDAGLALGIGVKIPINQQSSFFIEYAEQAGLANVLKNSGSNQNATSGLNIGLNFR